MITIITGPIDTGKTSWILEDYKKRKNSDGFACKKVKVNGEHIGYELIHLKNQEVCQFIRKTNHIPSGWNEAFRLGEHYSFCREGQLFAEKIAQEAIDNHVDCFYLDEVGHLELRDQGFSKILKDILAANIDLIMVCREALIEKMCQKYGIHDYQTLHGTRFLSTTLNS